MHRRQVVNIINFIRGEDYRYSYSMTEPVENQIRIMTEYSLPGTFLLQYDALLKDEYMDLLVKLPKEQFEIGLWFELDRALIEASGIEWRGNASRHWESNPLINFPGSYSHGEREKMVDTAFKAYHQKFGCYPKSCGAWMIDVHSLRYMAEKYNLDASCNCKDQWGTDGYTLWGGYWNGAYYPCKNNVLCPAQTKEEQINLPVFRMLGSDPLYQYDLGMDFSGDEITPSERQPVASLEPVYPNSGGDEKWVEWFLREMFNGKNLALGYAQAGQENSFGWDSMSRGFEMQCKKLAEKRVLGHIEIEKLCDTGAWFKQTYPSTPASSIAVLSDYVDKGEYGARTIWYNTAKYRSNFYIENKNFWIRDIHIFNEEYKELYADGINELDYYSFDNLPVMDGNRFSGGKTRAGIYLCDKNGIVCCDDLSVEENGDNGLVTHFNAGEYNVIIENTPDSIKMELDNELFFSIKWVINALDKGTDALQQKKLRFRHNDFAYELSLAKGSFKAENFDHISIIPENGEIIIKFGM